MKGRGVAVDTLSYLTDLIQKGIMLCKGFTFVGSSQLVSRRQEAYAEVQG
jgi:hypothetical protein